MRVDPDVVLWARSRALHQGTSVNRVIRQFLEDYAKVPQRWWDGLQPPWDDPAEPQPTDETTDAAR